MHGLCDYNDNNQVSMILGTYDFGKLDLYLPSGGTCGDKGVNCDGSDCLEPDFLARKINCKRIFQTDNHCQYLRLHL